MQESPDTAKQSDVIGLRALEFRHREKMLLIGVVLVITACGAVCMVKGIEGGQGILGSVLGFVAGYCTKEARQVIAKRTHR